MVKTSRRTIDFHGGIDQFLREVRGRALIAGVEDLNWTEITNLFLYLGIQKFKEAPIEDTAEVYEKVVRGEPLKIEESPDIDESILEIKEYILRGERGEENRDG